MHRKDFISSLLPLTLTVVASAQTGKLQLPPAPKKAKGLCKIPPFLKQGDTIGITCPAGYITSVEILPAVQLLKSWGFEVKTGDTVDKRDFTYGGSDAERLLDFQQMLDDKNIRAVLCARGGYGAIRIVDRLDFSRFVKQPKWIIGFSDITVFHSHIHQQLHIATLHSKMCNSFPDDWDKADEAQKATILSIKEAVTGTKMSYTTAASSYNRLGRARGLLVGGNLKTIESLSASPSDIDTKNKILFVEDTGEYLYSIDRMFWNLQRSGKLQHLAGLIIGGFKIKEDPGGEPFGKSVYEIVTERVSAYSYPVCFDFPVGHQKDNYALKCGVLHELEVTGTGGTLKEHM
jgi:muramoyltetrapeptide carboxypeptidase